MSTKDEAERLANSYRSPDTGDAFEDCIISYKEGFRAGEKSERVLRILKIAKRISESIKWYDSTNFNHESARPAVLENCRLLSKALESFNASPEENK